MKLEIDDLKPSTPSLSKIIPAVNNINLSTKLFSINEVPSLPPPSTKILVKPNLASSFSSTPKLILPFSWER